MIFPALYLPAVRMPCRRPQTNCNLSKKLEALGIPHPRCYSPEELDAIEYPVMIKPASGGGGIFNRIARNRQEL